MGTVSNGNYPLFVKELIRPPEEPTSLGHMPKNRMELIRPPEEPTTCLSARQSNKQIVVPHRFTGFFSRFGGFPVK